MNMNNIDCKNTKNFLSNNTSTRIAVGMSKGYDFYLNLLFLFQNIP